MIPLDAKYGNFHPNRCNICFSITLCNSKCAKLVPCTHCKLIKYCDAFHREQDRPSHEQFCLAAQLMMAKMNAKTMLDCPNFIFGHDGATTRHTLIKKIQFNCSMLQKIMKRALHHHEQVMLQFPLMCNVCLVHDTAELQFCEKCQQVAYCSKEHEENDREEHSKWCDELRINFNIDISPPKLYPDSDDGNDTRVGEDMFQPFPKDSFQLANKLTHMDIQSPSNIDSIIALDKAIRNIKVATVFSWVGTMLYALHRTNMDNDLEHELNVFILGAEREDAFFNHITFAAFFSYLPKLRTLRLYFIGPNVAQEGGRMEQLDELRHAEVFLYRYLYHELPGNHELLNPHLIIAFQNGFSEFSDPAEATWPETIRNLLSIPNVPFAFTSYTHGEAIEDATIVLREAHHLQLQNNLTFVMRATANPFRDPQPNRNPDLTDEKDVLYYNNGYMSIVIMQKG